MKKLKTLKPRFKARIRKNKQILKKEIKNFFIWIKGAELVSLKECNTSEDPVRPELNNEFRTSYGRKIYGVKYKNEICAIMCFGFTNEIPKTVKELDLMSKDAFFNSPLSCPSIINPELSTIHTGVALRDKEFEEMYHNVPHVVYISRTDKLKVGVTGYGREQFRWNDQGAVEAIVVCVTPYRQLAGEIEVFLKDHFNDKTFWRNMLKIKFSKSIF